MTSIKHRVAALEKRAGFVDGLDIPRIFFHAVSPGLGVTCIAEVADPQRCWDRQEGETEEEFLERVRVESGYDQAS